MEWWRRVFWLLIVLPQWSGAEEVRLSAGVEQFNWEEFADDGRSLLGESGLRQYVELGREAPLNSNWWYEMRGRLYGVRVGYDGETWAGDPVTTDTDYKGIQVELGVTQSTAGDTTGATSAKWLFRAAVGIDGWQRLLRDTSLADGTPVMGYNENYICYYSSAWLGYTRGSWPANLGMKLPLRIDERVEIGGWSVLLHPEGRLSLMASS